MKRKQMCGRSTEGQEIENRKYGKKRTGTVLLLLFLMLAMTGCGQTAEEEGFLIQKQENTDTDADQDGTDTGSTGTDSEDVIGTGSGQLEKAAGIEGLIQEQSFEIRLESWGEVLFASLAPQEEEGAPGFALVKDGEIVYTFPMPEGDEGSRFQEVGAVAFQNYNDDVYWDILVLVSYTDGTNTWNRPFIFLQENPDDKFYQDHPELESYRIKGTYGQQVQTGSGFYRDTLLEEYLSKQRLTERISDLQGTWSSYVDYVSGLDGWFDENRQLELFAEYREEWMGDPEYADEYYVFTLTDMDYDGRLELIVSNYGGTGHYTYSRFYWIDTEGKLQELKTSFQEGDSQPDLVSDEVRVYRDFSALGITSYYIVYDDLKVSADNYLYRVSSLSLKDGKVQEQVLGRKTTFYVQEGESLEEKVAYEDAQGKAQTREEFEQIPESVYGSQGMGYEDVVLNWQDVRNFGELTREEAAQLLKEVYGES